MKKIFAIILTAIVMLSMASCRNRSAVAEPANDEPVEVVDSVAVADTTVVE